MILFTAEKATQMALQAIQALGGNGYTNEYPTGRLLRDAKLYEIGAGTSEVRRMLIGRELFCQSAYRKVFKRQIMAIINQQNQYQKHRVIRQFRSMQSRLMT